MTQDNTTQMIGKHVITKRGEGIVLDVDMITYDIPMYRVVLIDDEYADAAVYITDLSTTQELENTDKMTEDELNTIRAELEFDTMRNLITGAVMCRGCGTVYHEPTDTEIIDIKTEPGFYCPACGERL